MFNLEEVIPSAENSPWIFALFVIVIIWSQVWKLLALWKSARKGSSVWFVVLALLNTIGILEILYIFVFSEMKRSSKKREDKSHSRKKKRRK